MPTLILRPSSTIAAPWSIGSAPHHSQINEAVVDPTPGTTGSIGADKDDDNEIEIFGLPPISDIGIISALTFHLEGKASDEEDSGCYMYMQIGGVQSGRLFHSFPAPPSSFAWSSNTVSGLSFSQAQYDAATFRLEAGGMDKDEEFLIRTAYVEIIYNIPVTHLRGGVFRGGSYG